MTEACPLLKLLAASNVISTIHSASRISTEFTMLRSLTTRAPRPFARFLARRPLSSAVSRVPAHPPPPPANSRSSHGQDPAELDNVTVLPNGVRVATEALPGHFSALGVYVDAGSRYENDRLRGSSHLVDRLAFKVIPASSAAASSTTRPR